MNFDRCSQSIDYTWWFEKNNGKALYLTRYYKRFFFVNFLWCWISGRGLVDLSFSPRQVTCKTLYLWSNIRHDSRPRGLAAPIQSHVTSVHEIEWKKKWLPSLQLYACFAAYRRDYLLSCLSSPSLLLLFRHWAPPRRCGYLRFLVSSLSFNVAAVVYLFIVLMFIQSAARISD